MRRPLRIASLINLLFPVITLAMFIVDQLTMPFDFLNIYPLSGYFICGLILLKPSNFSIYFFLINHVFSSLCLFIGISYEFQTFYQMLLGLNTLNNLIIGFYLWPILREVLFENFPNLRRPLKLNPIPSICTYRTPNSDTIYPCTLLNLSEIRPVILIPWDLDIGQQIQLQLSHNAVSVKAGAIVESKFDYEGLNAHSLKVKNLGLIPYIAFRNINKITSHISIMDLEKSNKKTLKTAA